MKKEYSIAWGVVGLVIALAEFWWAPLYGAALPLACIVEGVALGRPKKGDTLSEHLWAFYGSRWARIPLLVGLALFMGLRLYELGNPRLVLFGLDAGRAVLAGGFVGWFVPHLLLKGRAG